MQARRRKGQPGMERIGALTADEWRQKVEGQRRVRPVVEVVQLSALIIGNDIGADEGRSVAGPPHLFGQDRLLRLVVPEPVGSQVLKEKEGGGGQNRKERRQKPPPAANTARGCV